MKKNTGAAMIDEQRNKEDLISELVILRQRIKELETSNDQYKQFNDALKYPEEGKARILESITDAFFTLNREWQITYWNNAAENMFNLKKEDTLGINIWELLPGAVGSEFYKQYNYAMNENQPVLFEALGGFTGCWVEARAYPSTEGLTIYLHDITARKLAEIEINEYKNGLERRVEERTNDLEESIKQITEIVNSITDYFLVLDNQWRISYINSHAASCLGMPTFELLGQNYNDILPGKADSDLYKIYCQVMFEKEPIHLESKEVNQKAWYDVNIYPCRDGIAIYAHDITERKTADATLRQSEEKFSKVFHGVPIMMTLATMEEGRFMDANKAVYAESGYTPEEIIDHTSVELNLFPHSVWSDLTATLMQQGRVENYEVDVRNKAGKIRNCLCWSQLIQVQNQLCAMTATIDVTEQRRAQKELERIERLNLISEMAVSMSSRFEEKLQIATEETRKELDRFKEAFSRAVGLEKIVINAGSMKKIFLIAAKMHKDRKLPVLIEGETGTGKEVIAKYIHYGNGDVTTPFIALNCAAIAPSIFESELFGYEAGAFTGGLSKGQKGKLDMAKGGTLFLDEITELPLDLQAKLLRVLQENEYFRVGGQKVLHTDVRIICATNRDIETSVAEGKFRQDLYYRLNVGRIHLPPLRERVEDILPLAYSFLRAFAEEKGSQFRSINQKAGEILEAYKWPGNVREIRNAMQRVVLLWDDGEVKPQYLDFLRESNRSGTLENDKSPAMLDLNDIVLPADKFPIESVYDTLVNKALAFNKGNKTKTAEYLQISRNSLIYRLKQMEQEKK